MWPEGGSVGKGDSSRRRINRCPGLEKQERGLVLGPGDQRQGGDEVRGPAGPFILFSITGFYESSRELWKVWSL